MHNNSETRQTACTDGWNFCDCYDAFSFGAKIPGFIDANESRALGLLAPRVDIVFELFH
jgi:hypothetical protein